MLYNMGRVTGQREVRPVWNNTQRVNHQNTLSHPHPKRNFVPAAVLTKSGQVPVNTAKQSFPRAAVSNSTARYVNTVASRPTVNGKVTPLFESMLVQNQAPKGESSVTPPEPQPTPSTSQPNVSEPQTELLQTETPPTVSHEPQTEDNIEQILPSPSIYQRKLLGINLHQKLILPSIESSGYGVLIFIPFVVFGECRRRYAVSSLIDIAYWSSE
ncbi:hypothetical protein Tco_0816225 [Tanacetum coccineum]